MWLIISSATGCSGVLLLFLMTPEAIDQATLAQVRNRCVPVLVKTTSYPPVSQPITNKARGCLKPITVGSLGQEMLPLQFLTHGRCGEVPHLRQQLGPIRTWLETYTSLETVIDWKKMREMREMGGWNWDDYGYHYGCTGVFGLGLKGFNIL